MTIHPLVSSWPLILDHKFLNNNFESGELKFKEKSKLQPGRKILIDVSNSSSRDGATNFFLQKIKSQLKFVELMDTSGQKYNLIKKIYVSKTVLKCIKIHLFFLQSHYLSGQGGIL